MSPRVIPFPSPGSRGPKPGRNARYVPLGFNEQLYVFITALGLTGAILWIGSQIMQITAMPLDILFGLAFLYWAFIQHQIHRGTFLKKNWVILLIVGLLLAFIHPVSAIAIGVSAIVYAGFFARRDYGPSSFVRYHLLMLLISLTFLVWLGLLFSSMLGLGIAVMKAVDVMSGVRILALGQEYLFLTYCALITAAGGLLAITGLLGKAPTYPLVTPQANYWA